EPFARAGRGHDRRFVSGSEQRLGLLGTAAKLLGRGEHTPVLRERLVLVALRIGFLQLVQLVPQKARSLRPSALVGIEPRAHALRLAQREERLLVVAA